jgi:phosphate transport system substrate-binding protein
MKFVQRLVRPVILLALFLALPTLLLAQSEDTISGGGSGLVAPLFEAFVQASEMEVQVDLSANGTTDGINQLCNGALDFVIASRPISVAEDATCAENGVDYVELLVGHEILALVANPDVEFAQCLTQDNLNTLLRPSSQETITNWNQIDAENPDTALEVFLPASGTSVYALLDRIVRGDGFRGDATSEAKLADVVSNVSDTPGAFGVTSLAAVEASTKPVTVLELETDSVVGCTAPTAENVENRLYSSANRLFVYVNSASLAKTGLADLLNFIVTSEDSATIVESEGFTPVSADVYARDLDILNNRTVGREFSQDVVTLDSSDVLSGQVAIGGAAFVDSFLESDTTDFTTTNPGVTVDYQMDGEPAGLRRLCNGEIDIVAAEGDMPAEDVTNCEANNIATFASDIGSQAVVLVANADTPFLECLSTNQLTTIWAATADEAVKTWSHVDSSFDGLDMTLFAPNEGDDYTDLLLAKSAGVDLPIRADVTQFNDDPLYRAAATANVEGALTYMSWQDYQRVLANDQANIQLVKISSSAGCVLPSVATITDDSYPLARHAKLIISQPSLARPEVQALVWALYSDANYPNLGSAGFVGIDFADLPVIRENLRRTFFEAEAAAEATAQETTPEVTPEATAEAAN